MCLVRSVAHAEATVAGRGPSSGDALGASERRQRGGRTQELGAAAAPEPPWCTRRCAGAAPLYDRVDTPVTGAVPLAERV